MARRVFVIRDFEIGGIKISLEDVRREPPEGCEELIVPGLSGGRTQGQIFDDAVQWVPAGGLFITASSEVFGRTPGGWRLVEIPMPHGAIP